MRKVLLPLAASLAVVATPVLARDFAGPYVGAGATLDNVQGSGSSEGAGVSGVGGTVFAGYDLPLGANAFAGVEANADVNSADTAGFKADWGWGISGRLGYKLNESTGLYGRVGYARNRIEVGGIGGWGDGVRYGAGIETGVTQNVSLRAEFSQFNYEQDIINNQGSLGLVVGF